MPEDKREGAEVHFDTEKGPIALADDEVALRDGKVIRGIAMPGDRIIDKDRKPAEYPECRVTSVRLIENRTDRSCRLRIDLDRILETGEELKTANISVRLHERMTVDEVITALDDATLQLKAALLE